MSTQKEKEADQDLELLESFVRSKETSTYDKLLYLVNGVVVSLCPIYIYTTVFNLPFRDTWMVYLLIVALSGGFLSKAYEGVALTVHTSISRNRKLGHDLDFTGSAKQSKKAKVAAEQREVTHQEALSFAIFYNNALYLALVLLFGFYIFKALPGVVNFVLSNGVSAVLVFFSSSSK